MKTPITVLGLGAMGTALARAFLAAGHPTTVWNRTPGRSPELDDLGAGRAKTVADAIAVSPLVVVCLLDDASVRTTLEPAATELSGRTLVNLTNGTPLQARRAAEWAAQQGAEYLDGGIMAVPSMIGGPAAFVLYSGSPVAFERYQTDLAALARPQYVGSDAGLAALHDLALLSAMYGMFGGAEHALALISTEKISPTAFTGELLVPWLTAMMASLPGIANDLEYGAAPGAAGSNLAMQAAGFVNLIDASEEHGVDPLLLTPIRDLLDRAVAAGHGDEDLGAMVRLLLKTAG
ncbi:3-hydroxyisobutyrate dehydrogenase-like beta-hydroxyacid dehydrogenase [Kribbella sp. VKM Ac-2527]|uniref:3-hydroxyisobutyrate dehydrogenase-like beta-hydroxyacid dehydrogenase n=1 Tax=Kribbella caucasensis TaxID=2512215 RepID=A0A4R6KGC3_9ACTN|nr:NAD(P)-binding domain-containing protein [Kribbella sp. VKM Ac-2527]TDO49306.1 3-hydroxyisobutyrate dehydrogenase-like beta-hydroxyacid dehydrogenase [Kribbella sp. VKM Ac-2527]